MKGIMLLLLLVSNVESYSQCDSSYVYTNSFGTVSGRTTVSTGTITPSFDNSGSINDNRYAVTNSLNAPPNPSSFFGNGQAASICTCTKDGHTGGTNDAYLVVNSPSSSPFYTFVISGVNTTYQYEFGYYGINIHKSGSGQKAPIIRVILSDNATGTVITSFTNTFPFVTSWNWVKYSVIIFPTFSNIKVAFYDDESDTKGNDLAIDDIYLQKQCQTVLSLDTIVNPDRLPRSREKVIRYEVYSFSGQLISSFDEIDIKNIPLRRFIVRIVYKHHFTVIKIIRETQ